VLLFPAYNTPFIIYTP